MASNTYLLILLILVTGIVQALIVYFGLPPVYLIVITIVALGLIAAKEVLAEKNSDTERAQREMTDRRIKNIEMESIEKRKEHEATIKLLEEKQFIMKDFIKDGVVKEDEIIKSLKHESFIVLHHFNKKTPQKYLKYLSGGKTVINSILDDFGFVPVSRRQGAYFFHIVNTKSLPSSLRQPAYLEAFIRKKSEEGIKAIENGLKNGNKKEYKNFINNPKSKGYLVYLIGKIFATELNIGYLNWPGFDEKFLPYISRYANKIKNVDMKKLNDIINMASISYFIRAIEPKPRAIILSNEKEIKKELEIKSIYDYETIPLESWEKVLLKYFDKEQAKIFATILYGSSRRTVPIIREFS